MSTKKDYHVYDPERAKATRAAVAAFLGVPALGYGDRKRAAAILDISPELLSRYLAGRKLPAWISQTLATKAKEQP